MPQDTETTDTPKLNLEEIYGDAESRAKERAKTRFFDAAKLLAAAITQASAIAVVVFFMSFFLDGACS